MVDREGGAREEERTLEDRIVEARLRKAKAPVDNREKLKEAVDAAARERDITAKVAAARAAELAHVVANHSSGWVAALDAEIQARAAAIGAAVEAIQAALEESDHLRALRTVALETLPGDLRRFKKARYTTEARDGVRSILRWLNPPEKIPNPVVARNFGRLNREMDADAFGREDQS